MSNPVLQRLGLSENSRVVVFHADDIGNSHASVAAYIDLLNNSPLTAASTMVPCPWFPATADFVREQDNVDMGVHLTFNAEYSPARWSPLSSLGETTGLVDSAGYFPRDVESIQAKASVDAITAEMRAQIEKASSAGIKITHIDTHMGALFHPKFLPAYIQMAFEYKTAVFGLRRTEEQWLESGLSEQEATQLAQASAMIESQGMALFDSFQMMPLHEAQAEKPRLEHATTVLNSLPAGLHYFIIHPATDTPELRALADDWEARVGDHRLFMSDAWQSAIDASGVHPISMKTLQNLLKKG